MLRLNAYRGLTAQIKYGVPGPEGSLGKWHWSEVNQSLTELAMDIAGPRAPLDDGEWTYRFLRARANSIEGGTTEILKNIVAERVLGLPRMRDELRLQRRAARDQGVRRADLLAKRYPLEEVRRLALEDERGFTDEQWAEICLARLAGLFVSEEDGGPGPGHRRAGDPPGGARLRARADAVLLQRLRRPAPAAAGTPEPTSTCAAGGGREAGHGRAVGRGPGPRPPGRSLEPHGSSLTGTKIAVPDAGSADFIVVAAHDQPPCVVDAADVEIEPARGARPHAQALHGAPRRRDGHSLEHDPGGLERAFWAIARRAGRRVRRRRAAGDGDGRRVRQGPQAVRHADRRLPVGLAPLRADAARGRGRALDRPTTPPGRSTTSPSRRALAASMAKAYASDAGWRVTASSLQVHGGIGFTWEHDLHLLKRAKANAYLLGDARWHRERVATLIGLD